MKTKCFVLSVVTKVLLIIFLAMILVNFSSPDKVGEERKIQQIEKFNIPNEILAGKVSEIIMPNIRNKYD